MKLIFLKDANYARERKALCSRTPVPPEIEERVRLIVAEVAARGDKAISEFLEKFDGVKLTPARFRVTEQEIREAEAQILPGERRAIKLALRHIREFAIRTKPESWTFRPRPGVVLGEQFRPMERVPSSPTSASTSPSAPTPPVATRSRSPVPAAKKPPCAPSPPAPPTSPSLATPTTPESANSTAVAAS